MALYFARIDRENRGPFTLSQLLEAGVRPRTYVWTKGMERWERAEDVPDVCRAMRYQLAGLPVPGEEPQPAPENGQEVAPQRQQGVQLPFFGIYGFPEPETNTDYDIKPQGVSVIMAVILSVLCFPITGMVAIWFAYKFNDLWNKSEADGLTYEERHKLRAEAFEKARLYRIMIGLTVCVGLIMMGITMAISQM